MSWLRIPLYPVDSAPTHDTPLSEASTTIACVLESGCGDWLGIVPTAWTHVPPNLKVGLGLEALKT